MSERTHSPLPWRLEITDDVDRESGLVYAKVVDADGDTVFGQWVWKGGLAQTNMAFLVESVNRTMPLPDAELEKIRERWEATGKEDWYRLLGGRGVYVESNGEERTVAVFSLFECGDPDCQLPDARETHAQRHAEFCAHAHQDVPRLLAENERLLGLLDDLFRDHGANPDETPTVRVREENARLRESLRKIVDMHEEPRPLTWSALASAMRDAAREALGETP